MLPIAKGITTALKGRFVLFLLLAGSTSIAIAQPAGTFTSTGNMTTGTWPGRATKSQSACGEIWRWVMKIGTLILLFATAAAGQSPGTFTATGNLTTDRSLPGATLLPNGKVLIIDSGFQMLVPKSTIHLFHAITV
jgi:hypothetical protein